MSTVVIFVAFPSLHPPLVTLTLPDHGSAGPIHHPPVLRVHPYRAIRPIRGKVSEVACPPYDTLDRSEAAAIAAQSGDSFVHVIRPDMHLPADQSGDNPAIHAQAKHALEAMLARGVLLQEPEPVLFVYRQSVGGRRQTGLVCCVDVDAYRRGDIRKHEHTRPEKELERAEHIFVTGAHTEPVFLAVRSEELRSLLARSMNNRPLYHFVAKDGVTHSLWVVEEHLAYTELFANIPRLYIADGHHRSAAADVVARRLAETDLTQNGDSPARRFPAVIFPATDLFIAPYHRVIWPHEGASASSILARLMAGAALAPWDGGDPGFRHACCVRTKGAWHRIMLPPRPAGLRNPAEEMDVYKLQAKILGPILGIEDPRRDPRIGFVGGKGAEYLAQLVDSGRALAAFCMHPCSFDELAEVADAGLVMPPKSTWFEPKLRSGLFLHRFA
ncbi:MAG: DUF1015 domain-containing protein [Phycisphaerales bacterium]|nr:DUF1015 domain-containing protein [Phycisphaerales bacterium]